MIGIDYSHISGEPLVRIIPARDDKADPINVIGYSLRFELRRLEDGIEVTPPGTVIQPWTTPGEMRLEIPDTQRLYGTYQWRVLSDQSSAVLAHGRYAFRRP